MNFWLTFTGCGQKNLNKFVRHPLTLKINHVGYCLLFTTIYRFVIQTSFVITRVYIFKFLSKFIHFIVWYFIRLSIVVIVTSHYAIITIDILAAVFYQHFILKLHTPGVFDVGHLMYITVLIKLIIILIEKMSPWYRLLDYSTNKWFRF